MNNNLKKDDIGSRIRLLRKTKKMTMKQFGDFLGDVPQSIISRWENGTSIPNNERLHLISQKCNVSIPYLLEGDEKFNSNTATSNLIHCNLKNIMDERGLTIQNIVDQTTIHQITISHLYDNNLGPNIYYDTLLELCNLLNCTPGDMFSIIEIITDFKVVSEVNSSRIEKVIEAINVTEIEIQLEMNCALRYEGEDYNLDFLTHLTYNMYEGKKMGYLDIALPTSLHEKLDTLLSPREKDYFLDKLSDFLIDEWGIERLKTEGFEDANRFVVDFQSMK